MKVVSGGWSLMGLPLQIMRSSPKSEHANIAATKPLAHHENTFQCAAAHCNCFQAAQLQDQHHKNGHSPETFGFGMKLLMCSVNAWRPASFGIIRILNTL